MNFNLTVLVEQLQKIDVDFNTNQSSDDQISAINTILDNFNNQNFHINQEEPSTVNNLRALLNKLSDNSKIPEETRRKISSVFSVIYTQDSADWLNYYDVTSNISKGSLSEKMKSADVIFLPETHDNLYEREHHGKVIEYLNKHIHRPLNIVTEDGSKPGQGQLEYVDSKNCNSILTWDDPSTVGIEAYKKYGTMAVNISQSMVTFVDKCIDGSLIHTKFLNELDSIFNAINTHIQLFDLDPKFYEDVKGVTAEVKNRIDKMTDFNYLECIKVVKDIQYLITKIDSLSLEIAHKLIHKDQARRQNLLYETVRNYVAKDQLLVLIAGRNHLIESAKAPALKDQVQNESEKLIAELFKKVNSSQFKFVMLTPPENIAISDSNIFAGLGPLIVKNTTTPTKQRNNRSYERDLDDNINEAKLVIKNKINNIKRSTDFIEINEKYQLLLSNMIKKYEKKIIANEKEGGCVLS